jgi:hypothetical protein
MADEKFNLDTDVVETFRKLINEHKKAIRVSVLEELIESCYGPQALLNGQRINDVVDFKYWLEQKLLQAKQDLDGGSQQ